MMVGFSIVPLFMTRVGLAQPIRHTLTESEPAIHLVHTGNPQNPPVLFIHGSPGDWRAWEDYLSDTTLSDTAHLIALDRPGYGGSGKGQVEPSMQRQADAARRALSVNTSGQPAVVVGHSLGGPVAARLAMDHPDLVGGLLLLAPSIDPVLEELRWYNRLGAAMPWLLPRKMRTSNEEIVPLQGELNEMLPGWSAITATTITIQGRKDRLVHPGNGDFAAQMLPESTVIWLDHAGHLLPWKEADTVREAIRTLIGN